MRQIMKVKEWLENKKVAAYIKKIQEQLKRPIVNSKTGEIDIKYDVKLMPEDFFIPTRKSDDGITDIEYLHQNLFKSLNIPKPYLK